MKTSAASSETAAGITSSASHSKLVWSMAVLAALLVAFNWWLLTAWNLAVSLDTSMYLSGAMTLLDGGLIYVDFIDLNPPLAVQLHLPAVLLANLLHIQPISAFYCLLYVFTFSSSVAVYRLLTTNEANSPTQKSHAVFIALIPIWLLFTLDIFAEMGQRSHLFVLAALPYLIVRMRRAEGDPPSLPLALITGLCIGLTACLKPAHYALILGAAEAYLLFRQRAFKTLVAPEIITALAVVASYGLFAFNMAEASREAFFDFLMPLTVESYGAYGKELPELLLVAVGDMGGGLIVITACCLLAGSGLSNRYKELSYIAAIIGFTTAVVYILQFKGWSYHATPLVMGTYIMVAALLTNSHLNIAATRFGKFLGTRPVLVIVTVLAIGMTTSSLRGVKLGFWLLKTDEAEMVLNETTVDEKILIISSSVDYSYPMLMLTNRRPASRYGFMFPVPLLYDNAMADPNSPYGYSLKGERALQEQRFLAELNHDISTNNPALILVENNGSCISCPSGMTYMDYLLAHRAELPALQLYAPFKIADRVVAWRKTGAQ